MDDRASGIWLVTLNYAIIYHIIYHNNLKALYQTRSVVHNFKFQYGSKSYANTILSTRIWGCMLVVFAVAVVVGYSWKYLVNFGDKKKIAEKSSKRLRLRIDKKTYLPQAQVRTNCRMPIMVSRKGYWKPTRFKNDSNQEGYWYVAIAGKIERAEETCHW
jgi:predicted membrane protein